VHSSSFALTAIYFVVFVGFAPAFQGWKTRRLESDEMLTLECDFLATFSGVRDIRHIAFNCFDVSGLGRGDEVICEHCAKAVSLYQPAMIG
jgi:hypothetical protein